MLVIAIFASVRKDKEEKKNEEKKRNFGHSYLGNGLSDFLQIWNVDSPSWRATLQQIWFQSDEVSPRYKCVKMTFSYFLSIYSQCGVPASWAARHTIVCLDLNRNAKDEKLILIKFPWPCAEVSVYCCFHCLHSKAAGEDMAQCDRCGITVHEGETNICITSIAVLYLICCTCMVLKICLTLKSV